MNFLKFFKIISFTLILSFCIIIGVNIANNLMSGADSDSDQLNILFMATDKGGLLTDTIMIASYNKNTKKLNILSIPRDTRIKIGNSYAKINAAYASGEEGKRQELSIKKITEITNLTIHHYVVMKPDVVVNVIDMLDGVKIDVPQDMDYDDPIQKLHIHLTKGEQVLGGDKAEQYLRFRGYPEADLGRIKAQQTFIKALIDQKLNFRYLFKAKSIYKEIFENINTDISLSDFSKFLPIAKSLKKNEVDTYQLPGSGGEYFFYDKDDTKKLINEVFLSKKETGE